MTPAATSERTESVLGFTAISAEVPEGARIGACQSKKTNLSLRFKILIRRTRIREIQKVLSEFQNTRLPNMNIACISDSSRLARYLVKKGASVDATIRWMHGPTLGKKRDRDVVDFVSSEVSNVLAGPEKV
jgi:hypothetical protein